MSTVTVLPTARLAGSRAGVPVRATVTPVHGNYVAITRRRVQPRRAEAPVPARGEMRLTRRGRLVVFGLAMLVVLGAVLFFGAHAVGTGEAGVPAPTEVVTVSGGQTLWGIAAELTPVGGDIHETIAEIKRLNALEGVVLDTGQRLRVPLGD